MNGGTQESTNTQGHHRSASIPVLQNFVQVTSLLGLQGPYVYTELILMISTFPSV